MLKRATLASGILFFFWCSWTYYQIVASGSIIENSLPPLTLVIALLLCPGGLTRVDARAALLPIYFLCFASLDGLVRGEIAVLLPVVMSLVVAASTLLLFCAGGSVLPIALGIGMGLGFGVVADPDMLTQISALEAQKGVRFGGELQVNSFSVLVVIGGVFALIAADTNSGSRVIMCLLMLFCYLALSFVFIGSRQGAVAYIALSFAGSIRFLSSKEIGRFGKALLLAVLAFGLIPLVRLGLDGVFGYRYIAALDWVMDAGYAEDNSFDTRAALLLEGLRVFGEAPLLGHGLWGFGRVTGFGMYAHNTFVEVMVDFGLIGLAIYVAPYAYLFRQLVRGLSGLHKTVLAGALVALVVVDLANVTIGKPFFPATVVAVLWVSSRRRPLIHELWRVREKLRYSQPSVPGS